ncbi:hypothetical protein AB0D74_38050 [Streptomyces sp. NPDC048278]|uniref:hypothetical protein n=1 Tax=Streptomyces sp. NPDC048278 TaxID=3155809 RepID=UPI003414C97F
MRENGVLRLLAVAGSVVVAALVNVTTGMLTQNWSAAWWLCTAVLVLLGAALAVWQTVSGRTEGRRQHIVDVQSGSLGQSMNGPGEQVVRHARVEGDLSQRQEG